ncbi:hypothetical protein [Acinetobacter bereziniae]|uniref:hypothetical protein n=1 Tax=Acinetobacter bereziniae TaxID=106648 RepID=UPI00125013C3|nr:hypothetical protein [Acinetobacter bereziniae]
MNYFKKNNDVFAFEDEQLDLVTEGFIRMTKDEIDRHLNPDKFLSDEQKHQKYLASLKPLTRRQFLLALATNDLDDQIETAIAEIKNLKKKKLMSIEFNESTQFDRTSDNVAQLLQLINLDEEQINTLWEKAMKL